MKSKYKNVLLKFSSFRLACHDFGVNLNRNFDCVISNYNYGFMLYINHIKFPVTQECFRLIIKYFGKFIQLSVKR